MVILLGGLTALIIGFAILFAWWEPFWALLMGVVPLIFILGGALAAYLGLEEYKDQKKQESAGETEGPETDEAYRYRVEAEKFQAELEEYKKDQDQGTETA